MSGRRLIRKAGRAVACLFAAAIAVALSPGCDDGSTSSPSPPTTTAPRTITPGDDSPASRITDPTPATTNAAVEATQPASSVMNINGHLTSFPAARVRLENDGRDVVALLYSDDPREALKSNYTGNSFYLRMVLDIDDAAKIDGATWNFTAPSGAERDREADSPYGIFLGGRKIALQPFDVRVRFKGEGDAAATTTRTTSPATSKAAPAMNVLMSGKFRILDDTPGRGPSQVLPVSAELPVQVDAQR